MGNPFLEKLEQGPLVCDGAMGTLLYEKGNFTRHVCFEELNLSQPSLVKEVHLGYRKAGADVLETNTFGANRFRLRNSGPEAKVKQINREGVRLARQVASRDLLVAGAVGPLGVLLEPMGTVGVTEAQEAFREQMEVLAESGVDLLMIETMTEVNEALQALEAARRTAPQLPVVVQMTIREDGTTPTGTRAEEFARRLEEAGADVIGLNCSVGPAAMLEALEALAGVTGRKLSVQPNAGLPRRVEGRYIYLSSPEYMADYAARFVRAGAALVGGCCGTTPEHIRQIKNTIQALRPRAKRVRVSAPLAAPEPLSSPPLQTRSRLAGKIQEGKFVTLVEIIPPKGSDPKREIEGGAVSGPARSGRGQHPRRSRRQRPHERPDSGRPDRAADRHRMPGALLFEGAKSPDDSVGPARRLCHRAEKRPGRDGRLAAAGRLPGDERRLRHRCRRAGANSRKSELRAGCGRQSLAHRGRVLGRCKGESRSAES